MYKSLGEFEQLRGMMWQTVLKISQSILTYLASECMKCATLSSLSLSLSLSLSPFFRYAFSLEETNERQYAEELCWESLLL